MTLIKPSSAFALRKGRGNLMNDQVLLSRFFAAIKLDSRIGITHIAIYAAVLQYYHEHGSQNPMYIFSHELMKIAKISGATTYYNGIRALSEYGYLKYEPSCKRTQGSKILL